MARGVTGTWQVKVVGGSGTQIQETQQEKSRRMMRESFRKGILRCGKKECSKDCFRYTMFYLETRGHVLGCKNRRRHVVGDGAYLGACGMVGKC
jgi:hypothetical protein